MSSIQDGKKNLDKTKNKYFDSYKLIIEQEKAVIKLFKDKEKNLITEDQISQAHGIFYFEKYY